MCVCVCVHACVRVQRIFGVASNLLSSLDDLTNVIVFVLYHIAVYSRSM